MNLGLQRIMKVRKAFNIRCMLTCWSFYVTTFSLVTSLRTLPKLLEMMETRGFSDVVCGDTRTDWLHGDPAGFWTWLFILSKIPELLDLLFIVLRKRQLKVLHWYHHTSVLMFCWHAWATQSFYGIIFTAMNSTMHVFSYSFYVFTLLGYRPTAMAPLLNIVQILQMAVGMAVSIYTVVHMTMLEPQELFSRAVSSEAVAFNFNESLVFDRSPTCKVNPTNALAGFMMYASYFWLFLVLFHSSFLKQAKQNGSSKKTN